MKFNLIHFKKTKRDKGEETLFGIGYEFEFVVIEEKKNATIKGKLFSNNWNKTVFYTDLEPSHPFVIRDKLVFEYIEAEKFIFDYIKTKSKYRVKAISENWEFVK